MFEDGIGVDADEATASYWFRRGAAAGDPNAKGCHASAATRELCRMARATNRQRVADKPWLRERAVPPGGDHPELDDDG